MQELETFTALNKPRPAGKNVFGCLTYIQISEKLLYFTGINCYAILAKELPEVSQDKKLKDLFLKLESKSAHVLGKLDKENKEDLKTEIKRINSLLEELSLLIWSHEENESLKVPLAMINASSQGSTFGKLQFSDNFRSKMEDLSSELKQLSSKIEDSKETSKLVDKIFKEIQGLFFHTKWNNQARKFFGHGIPQGIKEIRTILANGELSAERKILDILDIVELRLKKSPFFRSSAVQQFYLDLRDKVLAPFFSELNTLEDKNEGENFVKQVLFMPLKAKEIMNRIEKIQSDINESQVKTSHKQYKHYRFHSKPQQQVFAEEPSVASPSLTVS